MVLACGRGRVAALLCAAALLSACGSGGFSLEKAEVDRTFYTSNVPAPRDAPTRPSACPTKRRSATRSPRPTSRRSAATPLPWANAETGARGQITGIAEIKGKGTLCRSFSATRESFDGVGMFKGEACMAERRRLAHAELRARSERRLPTCRRHWNFFLGERI